MAAPALIAAAVILTHFFTVDGRTLLALHLGRWTLAGSDRGLQQGCLLGSQLLGTVAVMVALAVTTPLERLLAAARWFRAPSIMVELASLTYRYLFLLREEAVTMVMAQRARLGYSSLSRTFRSASLLCGVAFVRAYDRSTEVQLAMECRGYYGVLHGEELPRLGGHAALQLVAGLAVLALVYWAAR
jgi:cobalt/nickel transport system permease protein